MGVYDRSGMLGEIAHGTQQGTRAARREPRCKPVAQAATGRLAERTIFRLMGLDAKLMPKAFAKFGGFGTGGEDLSLAIAEGLKDTKGVVADYQIHDREWGFDPSDITVPTTIWQGSADDLLPQSWAERLHDAIAGSRLEIVPDGLHTLWYEHWDEIFDDLNQLRATAGT